MLYSGFKEMFVVHVHVWRIKGRPLFPVATSEGLSGYKPLQAGVGHLKTLLNTGRTLVTQYVAIYVA